MKKDLGKYVLLTPAKDEDKYIEKTLGAVIAQEQRPEKWVIVSDGSTDRTDNIVKEYAAEYPFIHFVRREPDMERNFGSKVYALRAGISTLACVDYDFIGNLDADISFHPDYYLRVLERFDQMPKLGLAGGLVYEKNGINWESNVRSNNWSVGGMVQFFRREVYESIGGYTPLPRGGIDMIAELMVRMKGWEVRTFPDIQVFHFRKMGTAKGSILNANFRRGVMEYTNGYHPLFQAARFLAWLRHSPLAGAYRSAGYLWAMIRQLDYAVSREAMDFMRHEQMNRLRETLFLSGKQR